MTTFQTSPGGRSYIEQKEGLRLLAYRDIKGIWTIGYGHTGPEVHQGLVWTREQCDEALSDRLSNEFEPAVNAICAGVPTTQGQFDAMVSLAYNIGAGGFRGSEVAKWHRRQEYDKAADAFEHWDHADGVVNEPLHNRRVEEAQTYMDASPTADAPTDQPESIINKNFYSSDLTPRGSDPIGQNKAVVATLTGPSVGVLSWWANARHGLGVPEHVVADAVGILSGLLVWVVPHGRK